MPARVFAPLALPNELLTCCGNVPGRPRSHLQDGVRPVQGPVAGCLPRAAPAAADKPEARRRARNPTGVSVSSALPPGPLSIGTRCPHTAHVGENLWILVPDEGLPEPPSESPGPCPGPPGPRSDPAAGWPCTWGENPCPPVSSDPTRVTATTCPGLRRHHMLKAIILISRSSTLS